MSLSALLGRHLSDSNSAWSMGAFGAIAEFHQDPDEETVVDDHAALARATARGGIRIDAARLTDVLPVAYETLSPRPRRWSQALALCLPKRESSASGRTVLTELGPDAGAIRPADRAAILFDMGLALPQCDFCIRTEDPGLIAVLRANAGRSLFEHDNPSMPAIMKVHPHRVALTALGRTEVYQKIGGPDTGGVSPPGPHTHVLPKLLRSGRTHSANTPIPDGYVPVAYLHPGNPVIGPMGEDRDFDIGLHTAFCDLLDAYGVSEAVSAKKAVIAALDSGQEPASYIFPSSRVGRAAVRLALRQQARIAETMADASRMASIGRWLAEIEPNAAHDEEDDDSPGH